MRRRRSPVRQRSTRFARPQPATDSQDALLRHILRQLQQISAGLYEIASTPIPEEPSSDH